jgi:predicted nucleic acid-binding protein
LKVFLDANVLWKSRIHRRGMVYSIRRTTRDRNNHSRDTVETAEVVVMEKNPRQLIEALILEKVAALAKSGKLRLTTHDDAQTASKLWARGLPYCKGGEFYGAEIHSVECSVPHSRQLGQGEKGVLLVDDFSDPLFVQVCEMLGVIQGKEVVGKKQIADAFLLFCALENDATFFLTLDRKLIAKSNANSLGIDVLWPSELLSKFLRYRVWRYVVRLIEWAPDVFVARWGRMLKRADVLIEEDEKRWIVRDKSS